MIKKLFKKENKKDMNGGDIKFHELDKPSLRVLQKDSEVSINWDLWRKVLKEKCKDPESEIVSVKRYWYQAFDGHFVKRKGEWLFLHRGYFDFDYITNKFQLMILYHDTNFSSGFASIETLKKSCDFSTLTDEMPKEFKESDKFKDEWDRLLDPIKKYLSFQTNDEGKLERSIEMCPIWEHNYTPEITFSKNPYTREVIYDNETGTEVLKERIIYTKEKEISSKY